MKIILVAAVAALAGCASPEYVAKQSNYDVCRLTMGGPHSAAAEAEAKARGLDCTPLYPAISADQASRRAAAMQYMMMNRPVQPLNCTSMTIGNQVQTTCR